MARVHAVQAELDAFRAGLPAGRREADEVRQLRWMVEELRVSLFAQSLGTPYPISEQRIYRALDALS
jgi:ATP-dependent helicase HrpA